MKNCTKKQVLTFTLALLTGFASIFLPANTTQAQETAQEDTATQDSDWDYEKEFIEVQEAFIYHAIPSKDGKEAWIYEISVRIGSEHHTLHIPEMLGDKKVTCIGYVSGNYPNDDSFTNIFGNFIEPYHNVDGGYELPVINNVVLPDSLKVIQPATFSGLYYLREIKLPAQMSSVKDYLFYGCDRLEKVVLPENLEDLQSTAFKNCPKLKQLTLSALNKVYQIKDGCVITRKEKALVFSFSKKKTLNIPNGVKIIKAHALSDCVSSTVNIPASVNMIEPGAFHQEYGRQNTKVKNVTISKKNKVYAKDGQCIYHRKNQTLAVAIPNKKGELYISDKVRHLSSTYSLVNCDTYEKDFLTKVVFPKHLKSITVDSGAPLLSGVENIYFTGKNPPKVTLKKGYSLFVFYTNIYVPKDSYNKYKKWYKKYHNWNKDTKLYPF